MINILLIFVLIGLNAFFVCVEFAAVSSRRSRLDLIPESNSRAGQMVRGWLENQNTRDRLIAANQLGITMVSLALGAVGENAFKAFLEPYFHTISLPIGLEFINTILPALPLLLSLLIVTSLHVVLGEQAPKVAVLRSPERFALFSAPIMHVFMTIFKGFVNLLDWATRLVLRLGGLKEADAKPFSYSLDELRQIVAGPEVESIIEQPEREMLSAIIDFGELVVRQVAIPRTEILAVEADTPLKELINLATQNTFTKIPVYEDSLDHILGIVHVRDLLAALQDPTRQNAVARDLARDALFVPETISVNSLLGQFRARRTHIAIVLDEFAGTAGLVTLEDLVEEIVGEFRDPFDAAPPSIQRLTDGSAVIDGMALIEEVNNHLGLHLIDEDYDTIAGYILGRLGRIPQVGDMVEVPEENLSFRVDSMDRLRIARVSLTHVERNAQYTTEDKETK